MNIRIYTLKEFIDDFYNLEKVNIEFKANILFTKLYSDIYPEKLDSDKTVDDLKKRIADIIENKYQSCLPMVDKYPNDEDVVTCYGSRTVINFNPNDKVEYIEGYKTREESVKAFEYSDYYTVILVDHETKNVLHFGQTKH